MNRLAVSGALAFALLGSAELFAGPTLTGDTYPNFTDSHYFKGKPIYVTYRLTGLEPGKRGPDLEVVCVDDYGRELKCWTRETYGDANGLDQVDIIDLPNEKLGYYRLNSKLSDGTLYRSPWSSKPDGFLSYCVLRDPAEREIVDEDVLLFIGNGANDLCGRPKPFNGWKDCDRNPPWPEQPNWSALESKGPGSYANNPNNAKLKLSSRIMFLGGRFNWKPEEIRKYFRVDANGKMRSNIAMTQEGEVAFTNVFTHFVRNYRKQYAEHKPRLYELTAENHPTDDGAVTMDDYVRAYRLARDVIDREDPEGVLCGFGYDPYYANTRRFLQAGLGKYIDALTVHPYFNPDPGEPNGIVEHIHAAHKQIRELTGKDLPIYNTEFGFCTTDLETLTPVQMKHNTRITLIFAGEGWKGLSLFTNIDYRNEPGFGYHYNLWYSRTHGHDYSDYGGWKTSPKPVYPAISAATWFLTNQRPVAAIPYLSETCWGYVFKHAKKGTVNLAVWDWSGVPSKHRLNLGRKEVEMADHMGNVRTVKCAKDGSFEFELYDMPTYVFDVNPAIWEAKDGERAKLAKKYYDAKDQSRRAGGIAVKGIRPALGADGTPAVSVELEDQTGKANEGKLFVRVAGCPGSEKTVSYRLSADQDKTIVVPLGNFRRNVFLDYEVEARATMADGRDAVKRVQTNFLVVPRFRGKWQDVPAHTLDCERQLVEYPAYYGGVKDFFGRVRMAYDDEALRFRFETNDDKVVPSVPGEHVAEADAVEIALAREYRYVMTGNTLLDEITEALARYSFGFDADGKPCAWRYTNWDRQRNPIRHPRGTVEIGKDGYKMSGGFKKDGGKVRGVFEIDIPWHAINSGAPKPGDVHALALRLRDYDGKPDGQYCGFGAFGLAISEEYGAMILGR